MEECETVKYQSFSNSIAFQDPPEAFHTFPVTPSTRVYGVPECKVYRFGLVRLCRRIAAKIAATPSLKCVLDIQGG